VLSGRYDLLGQKKDRAVLSQGPGAPAAPRAAIPKGGLAHLDTPHSRPFGRRAARTRPLPR